MEKISKFIYKATVAAPTFFTLALVGIVRDSSAYFEQWKSLFFFDFKKSFEWWTITFSFVFFFACLLWLFRFLNSQSNKDTESISVESYSVMDQRGMEQIVSTIIPWLTLTVQDFNYRALFICVLVQCILISLASYTHSNFNILCSILGYRFYEVKTKNNVFILISNHCIKNRNEITSYVPIDGYWGLIK